MMFWWPVNGINFWLTPPAYRVLVMNLSSCFWGAYLSYAQYKPVQQQGVKEEARYARVGNSGKVHASALALDIDGCITTAAPGIVEDLVKEARKSGAHIAINTARPSIYCDDPDRTTMKLTGKENHYCYRGGVWGLRNVGRLFGVMNVPDSKLENMNDIQRQSGVRGNGCCILVDDRVENVLRVEEDGFLGVYVNAKKGITKGVSERVMERIKKCEEDANRKN